jgi:hypothetical protein
MMNRRGLLRPLHSLKKALGRGWGLLESELRRPSRRLNLCGLKQARDFSIKWPNHYGWTQGSKWVDTIRSGMQRYVAVTEGDVPQSSNTAIRFLLSYGRMEYSVIIDYSDNHQTVFEDCLADCLLYFKMQFRKEGYGDPRIVPGQYVLCGGPNMYRCLPRLRRIRNDPARIQFGVCGRFGLYSDQDIASGSPSWQERKSAVRSVRANAISALEIQERFCYQGGDKMLPLMPSLTEAATAKVCLDLPGRGPFCFRLVDYLSIGSCIVAYPHETTFHPALVDGKHIAYCRPDLSDLVDLCQYYLTHDRERRDMIKASRDFFDTNLHKDCIAAYYLECLGTRLDGLP